MKAWNGEKKAKAANVTRCFLTSAAARRQIRVEGKKRLCECAAKVCVVGICNEGRHRRANRARGSKQKLARGTSNEVSWMQTTY